MPYTYPVDTPYLILFGSGAVWYIREPLVRGVMVLIVCRQSRKDGTRGLNLLEQYLHVAVSNYILNTDWNMNYANRLMLFMSLMGKQKQTEHDINDNYNANDNTAGI